MALARALAPEPTLLLLDEPFASLDPNLKSKIRHDVVDILRATHTPGIFVTHDQREALAVGDRVAVMRSGQIVQLGSPWEVFHRPADTFCAAFMGEAAFLDLDRDGAGSLSCPLGPVLASPGADPGTHVALVRPDDLGLTESSTGEARRPWWPPSSAVPHGATTWRSATTPCSG